VSYLKSKIPIEIVLRKSDGSVWTSQSSIDINAAALKACLANPKMTPSAKQIINRLLEGPITGITINNVDGEIKLISRIPKCKVTIPLKYPNRQITSDGFKRLADDLGELVKAGTIDLSLIPTTNESKITTTIQTKEINSVEMLLRARSLLLKNTTTASKPISDESVNALATRLRLWGKLPSELAWIAN
jgi:hypothetical protein